MDRRPVVLVLIAGILFGLCVPFSKALIGDMEPIMLAGFLYAGAAVGTGTIFLVRSKVAPPKTDDPMIRKDWMYLSGSILIGGVVAPICLMVGLEWTAGSNASLLLNLEGVMTALFAVAFFHDKGGYRLWIALAAMTSASAILSYSPDGGFSGGIGAVLIVLSMVCWGIDNNLMQRISHHDPVKMSMIRSAVSSTIILTIAAITYGRIELAYVTLLVMLIGVVSYGISNTLFFQGLRHLGPSRTGTFFSIGPYAAAMAAIPLLGEPVTVELVVAGLLMLAGTLLLTHEK